MNQRLLKRIVREAIQEDLGQRGDITTNGIVPEYTLGMAEIIAEENMVICGIPLVQEVYSQIDPTLHVIPRYYDGAIIETNEVVIEIKGYIKPILTGERIALNFLGWLSGIATLTRNLVDNANRKGITILDTRKTTPTLRILEKYAVRIGGGKNHRFGLYDGVLIKDNHIKAIGSVKETVTRLKNNLPHYTKIEVEVSNLQELKEAIESNVDIVLLDNIPLEKLREAVSLLKGSGIEIEVSGGINVDNMENYLIEGINYISIGSLTHSARWMNLSLEIREVWR